MLKPPTLSNSAKEINYTKLRYHYLAYGKFLNSEEFKGCELVKTKVSVNDHYLLKAVVRQVIKDAKPT